MANDALFENETLLVSDNTKRVSKRSKKQGIEYLGGKQYAMVGTSVMVDMPKVIYAENDDVRIAINAPATPNSPLIAFGGITPISIKIDNIHSLSMYGTVGDKCSINFMRVSNGGDEKW
jgi:hypothetical protein